MSKTKIKLRIAAWVFLFLVTGFVFKLVLFPPIPLSHSVLSDCINNMRIIDLAKNEWALAHNKTTNDTPTWNDIKQYIQDEARNKHYIKLDSKTGLPKCPSGGIYVIGKVGEPPTCSLGTNVTPAHVLPP